MGKVDERIKNESLDRINIHANMYKQIVAVKEWFEDEPLLGNAVKGVLYEFLIDSLLNGYKEITVEDIKSKIGFTGENSKQETMIAGFIKSTITGLEYDINATRRSRITGKQKKIEITQPSECLPEGLEG